MPLHSEESMATPRYPPTTLIRQFSESLYVSQMLVVYATVLGTIGVFIGGLAVRQMVSRCIDAQKIKLREEFECCSRRKRDAEESKALLLPIRGGAHTV